MDDLEGLDFNITIDSRTQPDAQPVLTQPAEPKDGWGFSQDTEALTSARPTSMGAEAEGEGIAGMFATARNPSACFFHVAFKALAVFSFLFLNAFIGEEIITFVVVVLFAAFDFWTVKNVSGRLLVNLRWHSEIDEFGNEKWVYENDSSARAEETAALAGDIDA